MTFGGLIFREGLFSGALIFLAGNLTLFSGWLIYSEGFFWRELILGWGLFSGAYRMFTILLSEKQTTIVCRAGLN